MAVIDISMDMPKYCEECPYCNGENATCDKGVLIPWRAFDIENYRNADCPIKSIDGLANAIEQFPFTYGFASDIDRVINEYCDLVGNEQ